MCPGSLKHYPGWPTPQENHILSMEAHSAVSNPSTIHLLCRLMDVLEVLCELKSHAILSLRNFHNVVEQGHSRLVGAGLYQLGEGAQTKSHSVTGVTTLETQNGILGKRSGSQL